MKRGLIAVAALGALASAACGSSQTNGDGPASPSQDGGAGTGGGGGGSGSTGTFGADASSGGTFPSDGGAPVIGADGCSDAAKLIYVLSDENDLYSFDPPSKRMKKVGRLGCDPAGMTPNSMAIDRNAVAWVNYADGSAVTGRDRAGAIYKVSTSDASCLGAAIDLTKGWYRLGMGFSTDSATTTSETLFVTSSPSGGGTGSARSLGLAKIDTVAKQLAPIGPFTGSLAGEDAELTGTGDGRLYGFFTTTPVAVAELDKTTGAIVGKPARLADVETPQAWAFSFWGGDFYLYTAPAGDPTRTTNVTRYRPSDGTTDAAYMTNVGFRVVGAGVSTCAPVAPPR